MKHPAEYLQQKIAPHYEELWDRGGADVQKIEIDEGRYEEVPFFDLEIASFEPYKNGEAIDNKGKVVGSFESFKVTTSDGIDRTARLYLPLDLYSRGDEIIHADTAWTTTITGHNDYAASTFVGATGRPMIFVGAEHGTNKTTHLKEFHRVPETFERSKTISLAKSAQSSQLITSEIIERRELTNRQLIKTGESRGAMLTPGHYPYAELYGNEIVYGDVTAPCVPERMFEDKGDLLRLLQWPSAEAIGMLGLGLALIKTRALKRHMGTVTLNPNFMVSNFVGVGPAIFSGEAGNFTRWVPKDAPLYVSTFKNDMVSRPDVWRRLYGEHDNVYIREHPGGTHMTLANDEVLASKARRMNNALALRALKAQPTHDDWHEIFTARDKPSRTVKQAA